MSEALCVLEVVGHNVRSARGKGAADFMKWVKEQRPDVIALQETRCDVVDLPALAGYVAEGDHHRPASRAHCGVAIYTKASLGARKVDVEFCLDGHDDCRGRYVEVELTGGTRVVSVYVPHGLNKVAARRFDDFWTCLFERLRLLADDRVIVVGDFNTTFSPTLDAHGDVTMLRGDGPRETDLAARLSGLFGWVDTFRSLHREEQQFTCWPVLQKREGYPWRGTRIDYQLATKALRSRLVEATIRLPETRAELFSDHATTIHRYNIDVA